MLNSGASCCSPRTQHTSAGLPNMRRHHASGLPPPPFAGRTSAGLPPGRSCRTLPPARSGRTTAGRAGGARAGRLGEGRRGPGQRPQMQEPVGMRLTPTKCQMPAALVASRHARCAPLSANTKHPTSLVQVSQSGYAHACSAHPIGGVGAGIGGGRAVSRLAGRAVARLGCGAVASCGRRGRCGSRRRAVAGRPVRLRQKQAPRRQGETGAQQACGTCHGKVEMSSWCSRECAVACGAYTRPPHPARSQGAPGRGGSLKNVSTSSPGRAPRQAGWLAAG